MQVVQAQDQVGDNQQGQNDPNNTNAHNYDARTSKKSKVDLLLNVGKRSKCSSRKCSKH